MIIYYEQIIIVKIRSIVAPSACLVSSPQEWGSSHIRPKYLPQCDSRKRYLFRWMLNLDET